MDGTDQQHRPVALVTGAGRSAGIAASVVLTLAQTGWDVGFTYWTPYDERMPWGADPEAVTQLSNQAVKHGAKAAAIEVDLSDPHTMAGIFETVERELGAVSALVLAHCESVNSGLLDTSIESFDRHFAVNTRASWLLIREYAQRFQGAHGTGRIVSLTSDATAGNFPTEPAKALSIGSPWPLLKSCPTSA